MSDLHLSFGAKDKSMEYLFPSWKGYESRIKESWDRLIGQDDLVLIPGDISWAMRLENAQPDLTFLAERPGTKVLVRGNHDYWWNTATKVRKVLPEGVHIIHNDVFCIESIAIGGSRLWDSSEYSFESIIAFQELPSDREKKEKVEEDEEKLFLRELARLEMSLKQLPPQAKIKIALSHYPPIGLDLKPSRASALMEKYGVNYAIFGHLHSIKSSCHDLFGQARGVTYILASADWLQFQPKLVYEDQGET